MREQLQGLSAEEIEDRLVRIALEGEKEQDRLKALELLAKIKGLIKHGNTEKKDYREVVIGAKREAGGKDNGSGGAGS